MQNKWLTTGLLKDIIMATSIILSMTFTQAILSATEAEYIFRYYSYTVQPAWNVWEEGNEL